MSGDLVIRTAVRADLPAIVGLLADDTLGATREHVAEPLAPEYTEAFEAISQDARNELIVGELHNVIVATMQLTFIPNLTLRGTQRCLIEGVRVSKNQRGQGLGSVFIQWGIQRARECGCGLVQLTTNKARSDALSFYERLGFVASHEGLKLTL